jgi:CRP/FNR family transcriptional regulator
MDMVDALSLREIPSRLALFLVHSCGQDKGTVTFEVSQREIAKIIGTTPETLSRVLKRLADERIIATAERTVTVLDRKRLLELAGEDHDPKTW